MRAGERPLRAIVFGNRGDDDPGYVGERLAECGFDLVRATREAPDEWPALDSSDLLLVLGSEWSVYWEGVQPLVRAEIEVLRDAQRRGVPVLGICFGAQMLASALGGRVMRAGRIELGWHGVESDDAAFVEAGPWFQWHGDTFTVPPGAEEIARNGSGPQAFVAGRSFAVQFHPEVDDEIVSRWLDMDSAPAALDATGADAEALLSETVERQEASRFAAHRLVDAFLARCAEREGGR